MKHFGMNYGFVFTSWGVGGFMLTFMAGRICDATKSFNVAYYGAAGFLILAAIVVFLVKAPRHRVETQQSPANQ